MSRISNGDTLMWFHRYICEVTTYYVVIMRGGDCRDMKYLLLDNFHAARATR